MSEKQPYLEFTGTVICEDIRREANGKHILIGVYSSNIVCRDFPADLAVALWVMYEASGPGNVRVDFRAVTDKGAQLLSVSGAANLSGLGRGALPIPSCGIQVQSPGTLIFEARQGGEEAKWEKISSIPVVARKELSSKKAKVD